MIAKFSNLTSEELNNVEVEMYIRLNLPQTMKVAVLPVAALQEAIEVTQNIMIILLLNVYCHCILRVGRRCTEMQVSL